MSEQRSDERERALAYVMRRCEDYYATIAWEPLLPRSAAEAFMAHLADLGAPPAGLVRAWESVELFNFCLASMPSPPNRLDALNEADLTHWVDELIPSALGTGLTRADLAEFLRHVAALYEFLPGLTADLDREAMERLARAAHTLASEMTSTGSPPHTPTP